MWADTVDKNPVFVGSNGEDARLKSFVISVKQLLPKS